MKIRTLLITSIVTFSILLLIISGLVVVTNQHIGKLVEQETTANKIALEVGELGTSRMTLSSTASPSRQIGGTRSMFPSPMILQVLRSISRSRRQLSGTLRQIFIIPDRSLMTLHQVLCNLTGPLTPGFVSSHGAGWRSRVREWSLMPEDWRIFSMRNQKSDADKKPAHLRPDGCFYRVSFHQ